MSENQQNTSADAAPATQQSKAASGSSPRSSALAAIVAAAQQNPAFAPRTAPFHPPSGPADPLITALPKEVPVVGIDRARALRKQWLTQTRPMPAPRDEPDFDELEEAFDDEAPFEPPVHLPNLLLLLLDIWEEEGLLN